MKMFLPKTDIENRLRSYRNRTVSEEAMMEEIQHALKHEPRELHRIKQEIQGGRGDGSNSFDIDLMEVDRIYHIDQIQKICIDFRLRFLDTRFFKGELPADALLEIENLQNAHATRLGGFKIMAPSKLFKLEDKDDPLLFAPIGNGYYYLVHKWGNDLHPLRRILVWPFKNVVNLTLLVLLISYLATLLVPDGIFSRSNSSAEFWMIFFFMFKSVGAVVIFYGFALGKNFNTAIWNSKYYNA